MLPLRKISATLSPFAFGALCFSFAFTSAIALAQKPIANSAQKPKPEAFKEGQLPAQFTLLETHVRFESNGDSRKEVHAIVKINNEIGVQQFGRLSFEFNRAFEKVEIPSVRITHASGGTADILASAMSDEPNPAVMNAPAYQDLRVKSVRILGLAPKDTLEYRIVTTVSHHPLAPDIWLEHTFDRDGVITQEKFELDLPASRLTDSRDARRIELKFNPDTSPQTSDTVDPNASARRIYRWNFTHSDSPGKEGSESSTGALTNPDIEISSYIVWGVLFEKFAHIFRDGARADQSVIAKAAALTQDSEKPEEKLRVLYDFVSQKISTVDLSPNATGYSTRPPAATLSSGYATPVDKFLLLAALASSVHIQLDAGLTRVAPDLPLQLPSPDLFTHVLTMWGTNVWMDPNVEVAPFGLVTPALRGKPALWVGPIPECGPTADCAATLFVPVPTELPIASVQRVHVDATLAADGTLTATVQYTIRGDNELLLRVAFHQTPKENWKNVAQLLSLSDGFRGQISNVKASDPFETRNPFTVEYEITQPKFVNWSKKPVKFLPLLPLLGLPELPAKTPAGAVPSRIELGTPLDVEVSATLHLPAATTALIPTGTSLERDFAAYTSQYSVKDLTLTASRHINFIFRELPAERGGDFVAFLRTVQNDESQTFTLERADTTTKDPPKPKSQKLLE